VPTPADLCEFVSAWLDRYPNPGGHAEENAAARADEKQWLDRYVGTTSISQDGARELVEWKFQSMAHRKANALRGINDENWPHAEQCIAQGLQSPGDLPPLMVLGNVHSGIRGWGPAMSSAVLAACIPDRFTIADTRALATVRALEFVVPLGKTFAFNHWEPYLIACRQTAAQCGRSLREIDQAFWAADGIPHFPVTGLP
jgi:hypothetical protein